MRLTYLSIIVFFTVIQSLNAQTNTKTTFHYRLIDSISNKPVPYAHIYNESQRHGSISDSSGYFSVYGESGDILAFIALGYLGKKYIISGDDSTMQKTIYLIVNSFQIEEVTIETPGTYKQFQKEFIEVDPKEGQPMQDLPEFNKYKTPDMLDTNVISSLGFKIAHPVTALYYNHSKEEESKRKVLYLEQQKLKQSTVDAKYNREIVSKETGFEGNDLINFMGFCNFSFNYLYEATPGEIIDRINENKKAFIECCYKEQ